MPTLKTDYNQCIPFIYSASGAVVNKTIKGCPPKRANNVPPTACDMITFWTSATDMKGQWLILCL